MHSNTKITAILGLQYGDEGKGAITNYLCHKNNYDMVIRSTGGSNAGHTIYNSEGKKIVLSQIPSSILHSGLKILGSGMVIDIEKLMQEIDSSNVNIDELFISEKAHIIFDSHKDRDDTNNIIGTTKNGIGNCYADKMYRNGLRLGELKFYASNNIQIEFYKKYSNRIVNTENLLYDYIERDKNILLEGAQGFGLDIDHGTYPYVTSSSTTLAGLCQGCGLNPRKVDKVYGIMKSYCTRVGKGPFISEMEDDLASLIREEGKEYGSRTGRPRRIGWLNFNELKNAIRMNGVDALIVTKLDIMDKVFFKQNKMVYFIYEDSLIGKNFNNIKEYLQYLEELLETPIVLNSRGTRLEDIMPFLYFSKKSLQS